MAGRARKKDAGTSRAKPVGKKGVAQVKTEKRVEEQTHITLEKYRILFESFPLGISITDADGNPVDTNKESERLLGLTPDKHLQRKYDSPEWQIIRPDGTPLPVDEYSSVRALRENRRIENVEMGIVKGGGEITWVNVTAEPIPLENFGVAIAYVDITERKQMEYALKDSEAKYRLLADNTVDGIWLLDMNLKLMYCSPSSAKQSGFTVQEIMEMSLEQYFTPESLKAVAEAFLEELPKVQADADYNPILTLDLEFYKKDGTAFWAESKFSIIRDKLGKPVSILVVARDITERRKSDELLRESEEKYRVLYMNASEGIAVSQDGMFKLVNPKLVQMLGYGDEEIISMSVAEFIYPEDKEFIKEHEARRLKGDVFENVYQFRAINKSGDIRWVEISTVLIEWQGRPATLDYYTDITDRKLAEEALRQSEVKYRTVLEQMEEAYYEVDLAGNLTFFNDATCRQLGYSMEELTGMNYRVYTSKDDAQRVYEVFNQVYRTGKPNTRFPVCRIRKDGELIFTENSALPLQNGDGKIIGFRGIARDVTERLQADAALRASEAQYRLLSEHTTDFIWLMDMDLNPTYQSPSAEKHTGFTRKELMELPFEKRIAPESLRLATEMFFKEIPRMMADPDYNPVRKLELEIYRKDGTTLWSENTFSLIRDENSKPVSIMGEARDITERRDAKKKLEQSLAALEKTLGDTVVAIAKMVEMKDPFTAGHQIRVAQLVNAMAKKMNLTDEQVTYLNTAATIHDIGKIYVPSDILSKPGKLGPIEFQIIQTHVQGSYDILKKIDFNGPVAQIVYQHHERLDGSGYPHGLKGADILPEAKMLIVADVVEAMSSHRPYRAALGIEKALEEITCNRGIKYDEAAVDACLDLFKNGQFEFEPV